jgi:hypothetical protein
MERFVENYVIDSKPEQLEARLRLINENWGKYNDVQDELEELGHGSSNQQQRDEMEERYCYLTGFIQTKLKWQLARLRYVQGDILFISRG